MFFPRLFLVANDGTVATPDSQGEFDTYDINSNVVWTVNGDRMKPDPADSSAKPGTSYAYQHSNTETVGSYRKKWKPNYTTTMLNRAGNKPPGVIKLESSGSGKKSGRQAGETWTRSIRTKIL